MKKERIYTLFETLSKIGKLFENNIRFEIKKDASKNSCVLKSEKRGSNPRPRPWEGRALPTELLSHLKASEKRDSNPRP